MNVVPRSVVIIGGGFSGTVLAVQLLRRSPDLYVSVIDPRERPARGLAYGTEYDCHLLNVCSADMSAFSDQPEHFWNWAEKNWAKGKWAKAAGKNADVLLSQPVHSGSFFPRAFYGDYLASLLDELTPAQKSRLQWIRDEAVAVQREKDGFAALRKNGGSLSADVVVFATGNFPPGNLGIPTLADSRRYVQQAWSKNALTDLSAEDEILLVGSGLTSVDMAIALHAKNFGGKIHVLSRHGLLPHCHNRQPAWPRFWDEHSPRTIRGLLQLIREHVDVATKSGASWHAVMDSLRPLIQQIWRSLPAKEHRRFLRHARALWEIHRHRIAPEISAIFRGMIASGQIQLHAGRLTHYSEDENSAQVIFRPRSSNDEKILRVARIINCSGPELNFRKIESALLQDLFAQGLIRQDSLGLGLDVDCNGALLDASGSASHRLFALGPARKGSLWETTAVPDLRCQATDLADHLLRNSLHQQGSQHQATMAIQ